MMLLRSLLFSEDYDRSLRRQRLYALCLLAVGIVGIVCYFTLVDGSALPSFVRGFYFGAGCGLIAGALTLLIRAVRLINDPEARKKAKIRDTDERERHITNRAFQLAGLVTFFTCAAALFVLLPLSMEAFLALLAVMALYCGCFVAVSLWLSKKL